MKRFLTACAAALVGVAASAAGPASVAATAGLVQHVTVTVIAAGPNEHPAPPADAVVPESGGWGILFAPKPAVIESQADSQVRMTLVSPKTKPVIGGIKFKFKNAKGLVVMKTDLTSMVIPPGITQVVVTIPKDAGLQAKQYDAASIKAVLVRDVTVKAHDLASIDYDLTATAAADELSGALPFGVNFHGSASGGAGVYTYSWDFGDGSAQAAGANVAHSYTVAGMYRVTLTATDSIGGSAQATLQVDAGGVDASCAASPSSGPIPLLVSFAGGASGGTPPYGYQWDFGDGSTATGQNPSHIYNTTGTFNAEVTVTDAAGFASTCEKVITAGPPSGALAVSCNASPLAGYADLLVNFTSVASGGTGTYAYDWTFGDGGSSTEASPQHTYATPGTYTAQCEVTSGTQTAYCVETITVYARLGVTAAATPQSGIAPLSVALSATPYGGDGNYTYSWDFGDLATSTQQNPTHVYSAIGDYNATVTVTSAGASATASVPIVVNPPGLQVSISADPSSGVTPLPVTFSSVVSGGTGSYTYDWDFGDGSAHGNASNPGHTYTNATSAPETFTVTCTVTSGTQQVQALATVTVYPVLATTCNAAPTSGTAPLTVNFGASPSGGTGTYTYYWDFGDDTTPRTAQTVTHVYQNAGTYTATVTVSSGSQSVTCSQTVTVNPAPLTVTCQSSVVSGTAPLNVSFQSYPAGGLGPGTYNYAWAFGDSGTSTFQNPYHTYLTPGTYDAQVTVTSGSQTATCNTAITVYAPLAVACSAAPGTVGAAPFSITFGSTVSGGNGSYTYDWAFGDGTADSNAANPSHTFAAAGAYTVLLTVTSGDGQTKTCTLTILANSPGLSVSCNANPTSGVVGASGLAVTFTSGATGGSGSGYTFSWNFGDGSPTDANQNTSHTYAAPGLYNAVITVTDPGTGYVSSCGEAIQVNPNPLAVTCTASPTSAVTGAPVAFGVSATGGAGGDTYSWDFGDGATDTVQNPAHTYLVSGVYTATVTVASGAQSVTCSKTVLVSDPALALNAAAAPTRGVAPLDVTFTSAPTGGNGTYSYAWDFGDGTTDSGQNPPAHSYANPGAYTAHLEVTSGTSVAFWSQAVVVDSPGLTVSATADGDPNVANTTEGTNVSFAASASGGASPYTYSWDFGDGSSVNASQSPTYAYAAPGVYTVVLTVTDNAGAKAFYLLSVAVSTPPLAVTVGVTPTSGSVNVTNFQFSATASGGTGPYSYYWVFGDGATSTQQNPTHIYAFANTFAAFCTVTDSVGHSALQGIAVLVGP